MDLTVLDEISGPEALRQFRPEQRKNNMLITNNWRELHQHTPTSGRSVRLH